MPASPLPAYRVDLNAKRGPERQYAIPGQFVFPPQCVFTSLAFFANCPKSYWPCNGARPALDRHRHGKAFEPWKEHSVAFIGARSTSHSIGELYRVCERLDCHRIHGVPASGVERVFRVAQCH